MNPNRPITNPMLCGTIELMKADNTPEHQKMFVDEMVRALFLAPVVLDPVPQPDEQGRLKIGAETKIQFPLLAMKDGTKFFMAFTDWDEVKKWSNTENQQTFALGFKDYADMLFRTDKDGKMGPAMGFVINPFSSNVIISKKMVAKVMLEKLGKNVAPAQPQAAAAEEAPAQEQTPATDAE